jgi:exosome complex exonuclease DIS3/RRP44
MLPRVLTENLCSLRANVDRLAFSVTFEFNKKGEILNTEFFKSVIRSKGALTYSEAQSIIEDNENKSKLSKSIKILYLISKILRKKRIDEGALTLFRFI